MDLEHLILQALFKQGVIPEDVYLTAVRLLDKGTEGDNGNEGSGNIPLYGQVREETACM